MLKRSIGRAWDRRLVPWMPPLDFEARKAQLDPRETRDHKDLWEQRRRWPDRKEDQEYPEPQDDREPQEPRDRED